MSKSANLLSVTTEKVLAYDIQILFGRSMKGSDIIKELLPTSSIEVREGPQKNTDGLDTLESWLEGLSDG